MHNYTQPPLLGQILTSAFSKQKGCIEPAIRINTVHCSAMYCASGEGCRAARRCELAILIGSGCYHSTQNCEVFRLLGTSFPFQFATRLWH
jgi:hypothetical protein